ncbi:MAG: response regulator [Ignavibacteria bacterium]|jgi:DNA-binding response OmpR family regulator|nr:response regulator [Ignavibacteria bacterium]HEX2961028.1 response regulator [Ignavibacteriales bacterium]MCU7501229.1 response regulator [Ignavibacteria bacterium]MCU7513206.1 response regulator [Ignavibacteria bacterium]MCU7521464.1 response regulator [Ignavibacteria bacterium]
MNESQITILLVEDNLGDVHLINELIHDAGVMDIKVDQAFRLSTGIQRLSKGGVDLVLLDLGLPDSMGLDTLKKILPEAKGTPVVVLTGLEDEETGIKAVQAGAQDYLVKYQLDPVLFMRSIRFAIERKRVNEIKM